MSKGKKHLLPLNEGYVYDLATQKPIDIRKPEEKVRQEYEKILYEDYGYEFEQMDIEVYIQRGTKGKRKSPKDDRADIVIYKNKDETKRDQNEDILGIVETKRPEQEVGVRQLMTYMSASSALWGVWTNGKLIEYLYKDPKSGEIKRNFVFQIPRSGENFEDIGKTSKKNLTPSKNLKPIFRRMLATLYTNTNISRREKLGNEMIRLIFCKIWDEIYYPNLPPKFKVGFNDDPKIVKNRIVELFNAVKEELVEDGVFDKNEEIALDAKSISYVVGELEHFSLLKTDKDIVGDAFEVFAESKFVGEKGEFFTPRPVVKTCIDIVDPKPEQRVLDPACGSGGFLIYALEHVWKKMEDDRKYKNSNTLADLKRKIAEKTFFGIDKEIDLVKIAKAYMAIVGDGRGGVVQQNTLHRADEYDGKAKVLFVNPNGTFKKFDIIITNPPFGAKIKVLKEESKIFELGHIWKKVGKDFIKTDKVKETEPQVLFVERCLEMLKDGGVLGIVLPETYFHAPSVRYVLEYMCKDNNVKTVIDLGHNTFRPHNNAKTILVVLEKNTKQQNKVIMAVAEEVGHDHTGQTKYRYDETHKRFTNEVWDDTTIIRDELKTPHASNNTHTFTVDVSEIRNNILVPRYYWKKKLEEVKEEAKKLNLTLVEVKDLIHSRIIEHSDGHGSPPAKFKGRGEVPYVRVADIVNWEIYKNPTALIPEHVYLSKKGKNGVNIKAKDILFVRRGSYRIGSVAMVSPYDTRVLLTKEISVFRVIDEKKGWNITPFYLLYLFSHNLTQKQLNNKIFIDTTLPNIGRRWEELYLPIAIDKQKRIDISKTIEETFKMKWEAVDKINQLKHKFGDLTT